MKIEKIETLKLELTIVEARKLNWVIERALRKEENKTSALEFGEQLSEKLQGFI